MTGMRPADLVIQGGTVVNATGRRSATVVVSAGVVADVIAPTAPVPEHRRSIDATGCLVIPGGVDPHCHVGQKLGEVSMLDDYAQASSAALWGGTTTIIDFAIPEPGQAPVDAVRARRALADQSRCDTALHGGVIAWDGSTQDQLVTMAELGVLTAKVFTTYRGGVMADMETIKSVMQTMDQLGGMTLVHAEGNHIIEAAQHEADLAGRRHARWHASMRPAEAELASVRQILGIAEETGAAVYFVHQTTGEVIELVRRARARGVRAYSETCPHYLVLDDSVYEQESPERFVCCPPLRSAGSRREVEAHALSGSVDTIGSDHCCYSAEQKRRHAHDAVYVPNGLPGVESRLTVTYDALVVSGGMAIEDFVALTSTTPARLNGLRGKGFIGAGADADIVVFDPGVKRVMSAASHHMATDYNPYEGRAFTGRPRIVISGGRVVVDSDGFHDPGPVGRRLHAQAQLDGHRHLATSLVSDVPLTADHSTTGESR